MMITTEGLILGSLAITAGTMCLAYLLDAWLYR